MPRARPTASWPGPHATPSTCTTDCRPHPYKRCIKFLLTLYYEDRHRPAISKPAQSLFDCEGLEPGACKCALQALQPHMLSMCCERQRLLLRRSGTRVGRAPPRLAGRAGPEPEIGGALLAACVADGTAQGLKARVARQGRPCLRDRLHRDRLLPHVAPRSGLSRSLHRGLHVMCGGRRRRHRGRRGFRRRRWHTRREEVRCEEVHPSGGGWPRRYGRRGRRRSQ